MNPPAESSVAEVLRSGRRVGDAAFDAVYPSDVRRVSACFWTPVEVAMTAGRWLAQLGVESVLDVGSGAGKFCIVANLACARRVTGVEQRGALLEIARDATARYGAEAKYLHGTLESVDPTGFGAFYLFNPFGENLYHPDDQFDTEPELSALRYTHDVSIMEHWLDHAAANTCFLTYHGFGGRIPDTYSLLRTAAKGSDQLRLWRKRTSGPAQSFTLEHDAARRHAPTPRRAPR